MEEQQASLRGCHSLAVRYNPYNFANYCNKVWYLLRNACQASVLVRPCCLATSFFVNEFVCFFTWVFPKLESEGMSQVVDSQARKRRLCLQAGLRRFCLGDGYVRSEKKMNEPEGAMVAWQILLKGNRAAKAFLIETDGAFLVHPPHLPPTCMDC